jgi:hypothetical protein
MPCPTQMPHIQTGRTKIYATVIRYPATASRNPLATHLLLA